ncbi:hypothetical protein [Hirschia litorea]|uniref:Lipoprotein n=1 Tax=Hirschia litorea TaxID=1199156 RepID=A0ABW2IJ84_9PROT
MRTLAITLATSTLILAGCGTITPVNNHSTHVPIIKEGDVAVAILSSLRYLKWDILEQGEGFFIAKTMHKQKSATAKISYTNSDYSIAYVASKGLGGRTNNSVWKRWVHALDTDIRIGLGLPTIPG